MVSGMKAKSNGREAVGVFEIPVEVHSLASYFDKMQVGKKNPSSASKQVPTTG